MSYSGIGIVFNDPIIILHAFLNVNTGFVAKIFYPAFFRSVKDQTDDQSRICIFTGISPTFEALFETETVGVDSFFDRSGKTD